MFGCFFFVIVILDVPSPPRAPIDVSGMAKDSLILSWVEPEKDGGSKIIDYVVEVKESTEKDWKFVGSTEGSQTYIHVKKLKQKTSYIFKICARNEAGVSLPLISDEPITLNKQISMYSNFYSKHLPSQQAIATLYSIVHFSTTVATTKPHTDQCDQQECNIAMGTTIEQWRIRTDWLHS